MAKTSIELFARCAGGFEDVLAEELRGLGLRRVRAQVGGVSFEGRLADAYRACLWSRVATRVQLVLGRVPCADADELYAGVRDIAWEAHVRPDATISIRAHGTNANLRNTAFSALKAKDALCDRLRDVRGERPDVDAQNPDFEVDLAVHERKATVYLNLSGPSLHRRGYREEGVQTAAPLKETLAAGMLMAAGWPEVAKRGGILVDPMCGSGTIAVEAALMAADVAPGILRERWGFQGWLGHDVGLWRHLHEAAVQRRDESPREMCVLAGEIDPDAVAIARENVERAGVRGIVQLFCDDAERLGRHLRGVLKRGSREGMLATNPPYGERLGTQDDLVKSNGALATAVEALPEGWDVAIIAPEIGIDSALGRIPERRIDCHNGPLEVSVRMYRKLEGDRLTCEVVSLAGVQHIVPIADERSRQFAARFRKVARDQRRAAERAGHSCVRLYEADLPDYPFAIDLWRGVGWSAGQVHVTVEETRRPRKGQIESAARRRYDVRALVAAVLDIPVVNVHLMASYARGPHEPLTLEVAEGIHGFEVDLLGYPDTGLPMAQRQVREEVAQRCAGTRFANVGGGASAASVYAARAGALRTVTVEPFEDRAELIMRNLSLNMYGGMRHRVVCEDARPWLERTKRESTRFNVVLLAPPAWVGEEEREKLARLARGIVAPGGTLLVLNADGTLESRMS
ncbi:MAG: bifunctional 23S rRNA (guanine(2069)-N(7))-methyltransferase RlmK/23S rRNA (guanine(2445)-N(2))-methyltransferase RlmL [Atopobiaceae bacterium]|nr:bifunctional 23S rRNA (guanine(2069)-N(7))-methyltransferase RlmK/23S rRNA (guanine(2445)-N(2))-methyltransferase RlmL [Atopobiaceae bacterium]